MGRARSFDFDAVIGIGGIGTQAKAAGIDRKVNWIGVGSRKEPCRVGRGPLVTFDHFVLFEEKGKELGAIAPILARRVYSLNGPRFSFNDEFNGLEQSEIDRLLEMAKTKPPSAGAARRKPHVRRGRCDSRCC
jgi:hypothetical protein